MLCEYGLYNQDGELEVGSAEDRKFLNEFEEMIYNLNNGKIDYAVMAIENSTAGSIIPNYALIDEYDVSIVGEYYLQITHNLMALKGQSLEDIKEVQSHPMALLQCRDFFKNNSSITLVEEKDTAQIAKKT